MLPGKNLDLSYLAVTSGVLVAETVRVHENPTYRRSVEVRIFS